MAGRLLNRTSAAARDVGETLLTSKLQILQGTGNRRPSIALSILTGRVAEQLSILEHFYAADPALVEHESYEPALAPVVALVEPPRPQLHARTVYLSEAHLRDIDTIIDALAAKQPHARRMNRSAVLRMAIQELREAVENDSAKFVLENA